MIEEGERGFILKSHYWSYLAHVGIIAVIYFGVAKLSLAVTGHPSPVWPPAGFALAILLLFGYRLWPGIALGTFLEVVLEGLPVPIAFATAAGSAGGALAGAYLLKRMEFHNSLERLRDVLVLVVLACVVSTTISATFGTVSFYLSGIIPWAASGSFWMTWWLGDVLGVIVVTPLVLVWCIQSHFDLKPVQIAEALALLISLVLISDTVFSEPDTLLNSPYIIFPFLIWAALRFGQKGATTAIMIVSGIAIWHTAHGFGPFIKGTPAGNLEFLQVFTGVVAFTILILAAVITEHKRAEKEILETKARLQLQFDRMPIGCIVWDTDFQVVSWNPAAENIFGFTLNEALGKDPYNLFLPKEVQPEVNIIWQRLLKGDETGHYINENKTKDERTILCEWNNTPLRDVENRIIGVLSMVQDITERKKAEEELQESEEKYSLLIASMTEGVTLQDASSSIIAFNKSAEHILGLTSDQLLGRTSLDPHWGSIHEDGSPFPGETHPVSVALRTGLPQSDVIMGIHKPDGTLTWISINVQPIFKEGETTPYRVVATMHDITERKKAEEALKDSEERSRRLVEFSPYGIAIHSEGKIVYMNLAGAKILGTEKSGELVGKMLIQIIHPDYHEIAANRIRMQEEGKVAPPLEEKFLRLDGTSVDVEIASIPISYMGKLAMYGVFRDITERKKEEETRLENLRLETADKAKSEFLAAMSHELRTPLNAIIGFSDILSLEMGGNLNEKQKGYVNDIHNAGEHLLLIINDILDLSKVEAGEMELVLEKIPVNELLEETITLIKNKAINNHIDIIRDIDPQLEFIEGDKTKLKQVLFNLLSNAVKFSREEGGTLTIKAKKEGDMAQISVSDTGIGIKEENVGKLFHKFEQLESGITKKYGGTGLGLAITKQLVELHGGRIWAQSKYGEGSTFTLLLPIVAKKKEENK